MLLPRKVGPFTLMRKLDADGISESFVAILDDPPGKQVVARRILPVVTRDPVRISQLKARVGDLRATQHPTLVPVFDLVEADGDMYVLEEWNDGVDLDTIVAHCTAQGTTVPHNVFLNLATQVCNALEALHARPGAESGSENVLHLALTPKSMWVTTDGRVTVGRYGLSRSPTAIATSTTGTLPVGVEYLAPEQTHQDQKLTPASDIFALGGILYELLTLRAMFRAESSLQTIHRVRRAEVTTQLLEVKEIMPGLDKVLFRALSLNPRHRYQRAFVLREDLRGLMAGYSFNDIETVTRAFLSPIVRAKAEQGHDESPSFAPEVGGDTTGFLLPGKGTAGLPYNRESERAAPRRDSLSVTDLSMLGGEPEHTDALLAEMSEPISDMFPPAGRAQPFDADAVDTSRKANFNKSAVDEDATDLREGNTGWIPRDVAQRALAPPDAGRKPLTPIHTTLSSAGALPGKLPSQENTQNLLEDSQIFLDSMPAVDTQIHTIPQDHTQPSPANRNRNEVKTIEVKDVDLDAPAKPRAPTVPLSSRSPEPVGAPSREPRKPEPQTHGATLLPHTDLRPIAEPSTRTLELDAESQTDEAWASVPTANKHSANLVGDHPKNTPPVQSRPEPQPSQKPAGEPTARVSPPPVSAGVSRAPSDKPVKETKPPVSTAKKSAQQSKPPVSKPPPPEVGEIQAESGRPQWMPIAVGVFVAGLALAICTGVGAGAFLGLTSGAVAVSDGLSSDDKTIAMAEPIPAPVPEEMTAAVAAPAPEENPAPAVQAPVEPVPVEPAPIEPAPEPSEVKVATVQPVAVPSPPPVASVPKPSPSVASPAPPKPQPPLPVPPLPKPPSTVPKAPAAKISSQQSAMEIARVVSVPAPVGTAESVVPTSELDRWAEDAFKGSLSPGAVQQLAAVPAADPGYTRSRTLLYLDAKARGDVATRDAHLAAVMILPENKYNPVLLVEKALIAVDRQDWQTALKSSQTAEQHWARLPSDLVFTRKAMIYEIEAVSNTGLFYASSGEDQERLLQAIRGWERYENHVRTKGRNDLIARAEENLNKLYEIQRRLE